MKQFSNEQNKLTSNPVNFKLDWGQFLFPQIPEESTIPDPISTFQQQNIQTQTTSEPKIQQKPELNAKNSQPVLQQKIEPKIQQQRILSKKEIPKEKPIADINKSMFEILQIERITKPPLWLYQNNRAYNELIQETLKEFEHELVF